MNYTNLQEDGFPEKSGYGDGFPAEAGGGLGHQQTTAPPTVPATDQTYVLPVNTTPNAGQQMVVLLVPSTGPSQLAANKASWLLKMGSTQLALGILQFILNIPATVLFLQVMGYVGAGYWCGVLTIIAGAFGIAAGKRRNRCFAITFMVMSIVTSVFTMAGLVTTSAIGLGMANDYYYYGYRHYNRRAITLGFNSVFLIIALVEFVIAVVSSALCCWSICGRSKQTPAAGNAQYRINVNGQMVTATSVCQSGAIHGGAMAGGAVQPGNVTAHVVQPGGPAQQNVIMMPSQQLPAYQQSCSPPPAYIIK